MSLTYVAASAIISALVSVGFAIWSYWLKVHIKQDAEVQLERFRGEMSAAARLNELRYGYLQAERVKVLTTFFGLLHTARAASENVTNQKRSQNLSKDDYLKIVGESVGPLFRECLQHFESHRIYFPESIATLIDRTLTYVVGEFMLVPYHDNLSPTAQKEWSNDLDIMQREVERLCRDLLGVE